MFLGIAFFETLDEQGTLNSYIMTPGRGGSRLIADELRNLDRRAQHEGVDVGPLRLYAEQEGIGFRYISARMSGRSFERIGDRITIDLEHRDVPLSPNHAGYYGILLPKGFLGTTQLSIRVAGAEQADRAGYVYLADTNQLYVSSSFRVYMERLGSPHVRVRADLAQGARPSAGIQSSTVAECFGNRIDGLYDTSIASFIRAINLSRSSDAPQVFICHSSSDKPFVRKLAQALSGSGIRVWIDEAEIRVGDSLIEKIENGILASRNLVVVLSPTSVASRWCKEELRMALAMQIGGETIRVLPVLVADCTIPGFLREKAYADFRDHADFSRVIGDLAGAIIAEQRRDLRAGVPGRSRGW